MKLGMSALIEYKTLEENVRLCSELGLDFIELNMNLPICMPENLDYRELKRIKRKYGIDFTLHLPEEIDLSSFHPPIRDGHLKRCQEAMEWAGMAGIRVLNMHLNTGIYFTLPEAKAWINERYESEFSQLLLDSYSRLYELAKSSGIALCIENTCNFHLPFVGRALDALARFEHFSLTWDTGHDAKVDFREEPVLLKFADRVKHMHLHDFNGRSDHQPLYTGRVPVDARLKFAEERDLPVVIEVKTSASLAQSVRRIRGGDHDAKKEAVPTV